MTAPATAAPGAEERTRGAEVVVDRVSRTFDGRIRALDDLSLRIAPGEFVAITGPSGSGKSTLLEIIGSLDRPDTGDVRVDGVSVPGLASPVEFRRHVVGFVFQLHHLLPMLTARQNIEVAMLPTGMHPRERHERAERLLAEVELEDRAEHRPAQLSGGERQKVAVARALANEPRLLLADEPTGALDSTATERILDLLGRLRDTHGMTLVAVTHDDAVSRRADRIITLVDGRVQEPAA